MDPLAEKYYSVSPYAFCSGNPVNFVDWDGERWVDKNGFVVWGTKGPTSFSSPLQREIGMTMMRSSTGREQLEKLVNFPFDVVVSIDENTMYGIKEFGSVSYSRGSMGRLLDIKDVEIKIYKQRAIRRSRLLSHKITALESIAATLGHEIEHLRTDGLLLDAQYAPEEEREASPEKISDTMLLDYMNSLKKIELPIMNATSDFENKILK